MSKNPIINIVPKVKDNIIKDENFSNAKKSSLLLETKSIDEIIFDSIKKNFDLKKNNLSAKDKEFVLKVRKKFFLLPILIVLVLFGGLIIISQGSVLAPFMYTVFPEPERPVTQKRIPFLLLIFFFISLIKSTAFLVEIKCI